MSDDRTSWSLAAFRGVGYDKGRPFFIQALWWSVSNAIFQKWWCPHRLRPPILRAFGGRVGTSVLIRSGVKIHWPWKLTVGDDVWIGEGAWLINLERITIGNDCCVSQGAIICSGSHDSRSRTFEYDNASIMIEDGTWVALGAIVLRGVTVGTGSVVAAGSVVRKDVPAWHLVRSDGVPVPR
jgi:putative colanic acid biosynthesis acetyltransferase WcaF